MCKVVVDYNKYSKLDISALGKSPECIHILSKATKYAFIKYWLFLRFPKGFPKPVEALFTKETAQKFIPTIDPER